MSCNNCTNAYTIVNKKTKQALQGCKTQQCIMQMLCRCIATPSKTVLPYYQLHKAGNIFNNFVLPSGFTSLKFWIYGSGGSNIYGNSYFGGAGAGAYIAATVLYTINGATMTSIQYTVATSNTTGKSDGFPSTSVYITYSNNNTVLLECGSGMAPSGTNVKAGGLGGLYTISGTLNLDNITITESVNGKDGGNKKNSGQSNGYTVSGSGQNDDKSHPVTNNHAPVSNIYTCQDTSSTTVDIEILSSGGGEHTPGQYPVPNTDGNTYGYYGGAGGANTSTYSTTNYTTSQIANGSPGVILVSVA